MAAIIKVILKGKLEKTRHALLSKSAIGGAVAEGWNGVICAPRVGRQGCPDGPPAPAPTWQPQNPSSDADDHTAQLCPIRKMTTRRR